MTYRCRKNFRVGRERFKIGDKINIGNKAMTTDFLERGLIYETKEDKRPYYKDTKYTMEKDDSTKTMYYVMKGNQIIDRLSKKNAEKLVEELNGNSNLKT